LAAQLPAGAAYAAVRAPIAEGSGYAWFANRGIGRPIPESLAQTMGWFRTWLDEVAPQGRPVVVIGFSGGAAFAGGLILDEPERFAGAAILYGTLPFDGGVDVSAGRLASLPVFVAQGDNDHVIPAELQARTWEYLHGASGAASYSHRDASAHGLSGQALRSLDGWLRQRLAYLEVRGSHTIGRSDVTWPTLSGGVLPQRNGPAPEVSVQTPQQQLTQNAPAELQEQVFAHMSALAAVQVRPSVISVPGARAFTLQPDAARGADDSFIVRQAGEFAHIHPEYDGSLHVALPQPFAAAAIAAGWAVTHPLAGLHVPPGMVLLYGPRDAEELAVIIAILDAAHHFATT
ncbi:MAG: phospholipase/Carboxylesterase, partial [Thermoleophilia bacterium]|nr:phospholipase/Carboxylesterase [Thermoleophilia bacterium]